MPRLSLLSQPAMICAFVALACAAPVSDSCVQFDFPSPGVVVAALKTACNQDPNDSSRLETLAANATKVVIAPIGPLHLTWFDANFTLRGCAPLRNISNAAPSRVLELGRVDFVYTKPGAGIRSEACWTVVQSDGLVLTTPAAPIFAQSSATVKRRRNSAVGIAVGCIALVAVLAIAATNGCRRKERYTTYGSIPMRR